MRGKFFHAVVRDLSQEAEGAIFVMFKRHFDRHLDRREVKGHRPNLIEWDHHR